MLPKKVENTVLLKRFLGTYWLVDVVLGICSEQSSLPSELSLLSDTGCFVFFFSFYFFLTLLSLPYARSCAGVVCSCYSFYSYTCVARGPTCPGS